ncbi:hypothetical protein BCR44DRAFT_53810 [Catenaria anguillulae PL171]|uniref:Uncharacterized protein n=1 Tax=Catenaria anguillulae PL171 TaxID=765915 RepID=A0A1Y2HFQ3_9FUNG|nr:hypothetical protein BCR44DRAFT_53810 [Catenaria anguillulae PL171]
MNQMDRPAMGKPDQTKLKSDTVAPPRRPTALFTCSLLGIFTFTTVYHTYWGMPFLRDIHLSLVILSIYALAQRYTPQLCHHWRACGRAYMRGLVTALILWAFLLVVSMGAAVRMSEEDLKGRQEVVGELVGWFAVVLSWMFWSADQDLEQLFRELDAEREAAIARVE